MIVKSGNLIKKKRATMNTRLMEYLKNMCIDLTLRKLDILTKRRFNSSITLNEYLVYYNLLSQKFRSPCMEFRRFRCLNHFIKSYMIHVVFHKSLIVSNCFPTMKTFSKRFHLLTQSQPNFNSNRVLTPSEDLRIFMRSFGFKSSYYPILLDIVLRIIDRNNNGVNENFLLNNFLANKKSFFKKKTSKKYIHKLTL